MPLFAIPAIVGGCRDPRRTVTVPAPADTLADTDRHSHVAAIARVARKVCTRSSRTGLPHRYAETAFYVCTVPITAPRAAAAIRARRRIETASRDGRDVTFGEDRSRIRANPGAFARLRRSGSRPAAPTRRPGTATVRRAPASIIRS